MKSPTELLVAELRATSDRVQRLAIRRARRERQADRLHRDLLQKQRFGTALVLLGPLVVVLVLLIPATAGPLPYALGFATSAVGAFYRDRIQNRIERARSVSDRDKRRSARGRQV